MAGKGNELSSPPNILFLFNLWERFCGSLGRVIGLPISMSILNKCDVEIEMLQDNIEYFVGPALPLK